MLRPHTRTFTGLMTAPFAKLTIAISLVLTLITQSRAAIFSSSAAGVAVAIDEATGTYSVTAEHPAWKFSGTVGAPMTSVSITSGQDKLGTYREVSFQWEKGTPLQGSIREYDNLPAVRFALSTPRAIAHMGQDFPAFTTFPPKLHVLNYAEDTMSPPSFKLKESGTPWFFFDDDADTAILSSGSDFLVSQMHGDGKNLVASGLNTTLTHLPAGFTHLSWLVLGQGIESTVHAWGNVLTDLSGKPRPADNTDLLVKYLGYWTDNGTFYYYNYDKTKGYAGTLLALAEHYRAEKIPIHYMQLDSWWYQKTRTAANGKLEGPKRSSLPNGTWNAYGGTLDYTASPDLFPDGLSAFQKELGLPLVVHGRWIDPTSHYHEDYNISGLAAVDPKWWDDRADYMKQSGVVTYEQDWLCDIYLHSPQMSNTLSAGPAFTDNMARATKEHGQTLQYCMGLPRFFMQGSLYDNLITIRTSYDRFNRSNWNIFLYTSILADALRIRPWTDAFMSTELGNLTVATLSSGPVGTGDAIGKESRANLLRAAREDGVIVKPDAPLLPVDASIIADAANLHHPLLASTFTDNGERTAYAFAFTRKGDRTDVSFTPASLGMAGRTYIYKTSDGSGKLIEAKDTYTDSLKDPDWNLYAAAPVGRSAIALLGDAGKIVGTGRQSIPAVRDEPGKLTVTLTMSPSEKSVVLHGYSASAPTVSVEGGSSQPVAYDTRTGQFTVRISADPAAHSQLVDGDEVVFVMVILKTKD